MIPNFNLKLIGAGITAVILIGFWSYVQYLQHKVTTQNESLEQAKIQRQITEQETKVKHFEELQQVEFDVRKDERNETIPTSIGTHTLTFP